MKVTDPASIPDETGPAHFIMVIELINSGKEDHE
jgi:hypothetical protein